MTDIPWIHPTENSTDTLWNYLRLGGIQFPGVWTCETSKKRELNIVKVKALDGVRILDNGYFGVALRANGRIWTAAQWSELQSIMPDFDPQSPGGGRTPLDFYHPAGAFFNVGTVYIAEIALGKAGAGIIPMSIEMVQWFTKPKPFIQGFAGTRKSGAPLNAKDFSVTKPSANTGGKL